MQVTLQLDEPGTIWCRDAHLLICRGLGGELVTLYRTEVRP